MIWFEDNPPKLVFGDKSHWGYYRNNPSSSKLGEGFPGKLSGQTVSYLCGRFGSAKLLYQLKSGTPKPRNQGMGG